MTKIGKCFARFSRIYKKFIFETDIFKSNNYTTTILLFLPITQHCGFRMHNRQVIFPKTSLNEKNGHNLLGDDCDR